MYFEGKYYKHQLNGNTLCLIRGKADDGEFLQIIAGGRVYHFDEFTDCVFSDSGIVLNLPNIKGEIRYFCLTPLKSDIMGFFRFFPLQCKHSVTSMRHDLLGGVEVDGKFFDFGGGVGYIEGDRGRSFPKQYIWLHSNDFSDECSIMVSVADIPFLGVHFLGCICAIVYKGREYRLATYHGVKIKELTKERLVLTQKNLRLEIDIASDNADFAGGILDNLSGLSGSNNSSGLSGLSRISSVEGDVVGRGFLPLKMPIRGRMSAVVHESNSASARFRLFENHNLVFDLRSDNTSFEFNF